MINKKLLLAGFVTLSLSACAGAPKVDNGQYWQRISSSDLIYTQGPKAQQMLNRDISRCVVELRELERLGMIKDAIPTDAEGRVLDPDQKALYDWDTPERDQYLFMEHSDYHDFESCMLAQGWERTKHVPYDVVERAEENFFKARFDYTQKPVKYEDQFSHGNKTPTSNEVGDYGGLND